MTIDLRAERRNRGLTLRAAADGASVDYTVLQRAERGSRPHPENAKLIADFYGVKVTDLWPLDEPKRAAV